MSLTIWLYSPDGLIRNLLETVERGTWARVLNKEGWFELTMPISNFDIKLLQVDCIVEIWIEPVGGTNYCEFAGFVRKLAYATSQDGITRVTIAGPCVNEVIRRRIVAYYAGSAYSTKDTYADDLLKALARENLGALITDVARDLTAAGLTIAPDDSLGFSMAFSCAWDQLDGAFADLCKAATSYGIPLYWQVVSKGGAKLVLETYQGQPGADRTTGEGLVVFGLEYGNLSAPVLEMDYTQEVTVVYAGGSDTGAARSIIEVEDAARTARSPWGRREAFKDARNEATDRGIETLANVRLFEGRPKLSFRGILLDTAEARYGTDWYFGDRVLVTYLGVQYPALVKTVNGKIDADGSVIIIASYEVADEITW